MDADKITGVFALDMDAKAERLPDFPAVTFDGSPHPDEVLSYADLVRKGRRLARHMANLGIGRGDTFSIIMRNHPENPIALYAASALGAIMVPVDPRSKGEKLRYQIQNSGSKGVIYSAEFLERMSDVMSGLPDIKTIGIAYKDDFGVPVRPDLPDMADILAGPDEPRFDFSDHRLEDPLMILYSSGTTGDPKGVHMRGDRLVSLPTVAQFVWRYTPEDKLYNGLSLSHANAYVITMLPGLYLAIPSVLSRQFTKTRFWDIVRAHGCTCITNLGGVMMGLYSEPPRPDDGDNPVRLCVSAGTPKTIWEDFEKRFNLKIHEWYATTEGGFAHKPPEAGPIGSFGKPLEGLFEMKVVRDDGSECAPGEIGELVSRNAQGETKVEYHNNREASAEKVRDGWLMTGDMCHRDEEGWFFFDFRKGGGLRRQGDFIMPEYVEKVIAEHPNVNDVCVYGIPAASGAPGESDLVAAIVPALESRHEIESILRHCSSGLERNSIPTYIQVVPEIPKTASEKNLDRLLRDEFDANGPNVYSFDNYQ
ncbi:MAG: AMP-binding protein [Proteobacteria bacterium]|nr:AMP-binding protein [Pseudomonadota bacterium]